MIYIGKYYSDIMFSAKLFSAAILLYKPIYDYEAISVFAYSDSQIIEDNLLNMNFARFVASVLVEKTDSSEQCLFYDYRTAANVLQVAPELKFRFVNSAMPYINWLNNKTTTRLWLSDVLKTPTVCVLAGNECTFSRLTRMFPQCKKFVVQSEISSGGKGTYILDKQNKAFVISRLSRYGCYLVSPYIDNTISYNSHIAVSDQGYWISPISEQIVSYNESNPLYTGSRFSVKNSVDAKNSLQYIANRLHTIGFRGICGIDFLMQNETFIYVECNNRLQGSSAALDMLMQKNNYPSLYSLLLNPEYISTLSELNLSKSITLVYSTNAQGVYLARSNGCVTAQEVHLNRHWCFEEE